MSEGNNVPGDNSPGGIPGQESFYEHVQLTFDGNYLLARAWAGEVERFMPAAMTNHAAAHWASQETCEHPMALTDWNRGNVIEELIRRGFLFVSSTANGRSGWGRGPTAR